MEDIEIIKSLLNGNHLNDMELERAIKLNYLIDLELKRRLKIENEIQYNT